MPFLENSSQTNKLTYTTQYVATPTNKIWFAKSAFLELVCPTVPTPELSIIPCVLSDLGQVMCDVDHVYATMSHPPIWQSMPRSNRNWHRITVLCRCFRETLCCQLGLGDWLASQSPNQVDSTHGANKNCQPTTKVNYFGNFLGHGPPEYSNSGVMYGSVQPAVKHHAQLDNSWSHIMPN